AAVQPQIHEISRQVFRIRPAGDGIRDDERHAMFAQEPHELIGAEARMTNLDRVPQCALFPWLEPRILHTRVMALSETRGGDGVCRQQFEKSREGVRAECEVRRKLPEKWPEL